MKRWGFWALAAVMVAVYLVIVLWSLPIISAEAGGLKPFDLRPTGYSLAEAQTFLAALSEAGYAQYQGPQRWLDTAYPLLLAAVLMWAMWRLTDGQPDWMRLVLALLITGGASFDFLENLWVAQLLAAGPDGVVQSMVDRASSATVQKSMLTTVALFGMVGLLVRKWRARRRG